MGHVSSGDGEEYPGARKVLAALRSHSNGMGFNIIRRQPASQDDSELVEHACTTPGGFRSAGGEVMVPSLTTPLRGGPIVA
ncbi:MAG: hypothetical protein AMXMBFR83_11000 [Phycisphaerae bacterium]